MEIGVALEWASSPYTREVLLKLLLGHRFNEKEADRAYGTLWSESAQRITQKVGPRYARYFPSNRHGGSWLGNPIGVVDHYTAGISAKSTLVWFSNRPRGPGVGQSSAHAVIDFDGTIYLVISLERIAWHARGANCSHVGIEHVNPGLLRKGTRRIMFRGTRALPRHMEKHVSESGGKLWYEYTTKQIASNIALKRLALCMYPDSMVRERFVDHQMVDPRRKQDCGPLWPLDKINDFVFSWKSIEGFPLPAASHLTAKDVTKLNHQTV